MNTITPAPVARTGDDTPAANVWGYVWRMSGARQCALAALALLVTALNLAPIELQRRLIDDAITPKDPELLWRLALVYGGVIVAHQSAKFLLQATQGWLTESAAAYTRRHLLGLYAKGSAGRDAPPGEAVSILGSEVEKLAGFVGTGPSGALTDVSLLIGVAAYMLWVDPLAAALGLALVAPQALFAPLMQQRLNRLMARQLSLSRELGSEVAETREQGESALAAPSRLIRGLYRNRMAIELWKAAMKAGLNLLNAAAPLGLLAVGGFLVIAGETTVGVLVAFLSGLQRMADPIRDLIGFYRRAAQAQVQHDMIARWM